MKKQTNPDIKAHLIRSAFYVLLLLAICVIPFALAQRGTGKRAMAPRGDCPTPWTLKADMPLDLDYPAGVSDGTFFYAISGYSFSVGNTVTSVYRYTPGTDSWDTRADIPLGALGHVAVYYPTTNKIYVFGGEDPGGNNFNNTQIYDIATDSWTAGAPMPDLGSFMAAGYVPSTNKIYIISGYNTGFIGSEQNRTWAYDPVGDSWTDLTATVPFPHPAGGFAYGVINNKVYISGGRDPGGPINLTWEFDPVGLTYTAKANMPGTQPNQAGSAVAVNALFVFGGGNPFLAAQTTAAKASASTKASSGTTRVSSGGNKTAVASKKALIGLAKTAFPIAVGPVAAKERPLIPLTTNHTWVYNPAADQWTTSANMNNSRSGPGGAYISGSNEIMAAGGFDNNTFFDTASAEVLTPCIPAPTPTPTPCPPTPTPSPPCGLVIGDGLTIGFAPNGYQQIASNIVNYTFSSSVNAPNEYAIFETHDPWFGTVVKDAITGAGHTYTVFTPCDLATVDFTQYRVIVLNWDDTFVAEFLADYSAALPALEAYSAGGGVVWVQGATQSFGVDCYPLPFGGQACTDFGAEDPIVDICSPMVAGIPSPIVGNFASHVTATDLPAAAHIVVINDSDSNPVLYDLKCQTASPTPTPTPPLCNTGLIHNGGFETGTLADWTVDGTLPSPEALNVLAHSGRFSALLGGNPSSLEFCSFGTEPLGDSSFYQEFGPVPAGAILSFWHWDCTTDSITFDWQDAYITDTSGNILETIYHQCSNGQCWKNQIWDLSPWVGQTIRIKYLVHQDGFGDITTMFVDDVRVFVPGPCAPTVTPTPRATPTPRGRPTPPPRP